MKFAAPFRWLKHFFRPPREQKLDLRRRSLLVAGSAGIGGVLLARTSGAPITAFYVAVQRAWVLNTWDKLVIPKPFSPVLVRVARKIFVPPDADDAAMEKYHAEMQAALERVTEFAEAQVMD